MPSGCHRAAIGHRLRRAALTPVFLRRRRSSVSRPASVSPQDQVREGEDSQNARDEQDDDQGSALALGGGEAGQNVAYALYGVPDNWDFRPARRFNRRFRARSGGSRGYWCGRGDGRLSRSRCGSSSESGRRTSCGHGRRRGSRSRGGGRRSHGPLSRRRYGGSRGGRRRCSCGPRRGCSSGGRSGCSCGR